MSEPQHATEAEIEQRIQEKGLNGARLTPELIDKLVGRVDYHVFAGTCVTVCCITLTNGHNVIGYSSCISPANFDPEVGKTVAFTKAREAIWELEGYLLRHKINAGES